MVLCKQLRILLVCVCLMVLMCEAAMACGKDSAWTGAVAREVKGKLLDVELQVKRFNNLAGTSQGVQEFDRLKEMLEDVGDFQKEIKKARRENDREALRHFKKHAAKLRQIREELGMGVAMERNVEALEDMLDKEMADLKKEGDIGFQEQQDRLGFIKDNLSAIGMGLAFASTYDVGGTKTEAQKSLGALADRVMDLQSRLDKVTKSDG